MNILVINSGSSSLKYQLYDMIAETMLVKGRMECIGSPQSFMLEQGQHGPERKEHLPLPDHAAALAVMLSKLTDPEHGVIHNLRDIDGIGHRIVHGGETFTAATFIDEQVKTQIRELYDLAPLHNPAHMTGIEAVEQLLGCVPQVAVFDTAFHQSMPACAYRYPIAKEWYRKHGIRRYGFHGTSHEYVSEQASLLVQTPLDELKIVSCHIGNGASCTAIENGRSVDTSMGMTPLEGLMMGTRTGDIDAAILPYLMKKEALDCDTVSSMLNKSSGLLAVSGRSGDVREVSQAADSGDADAKLALEMYEYRIRKYIGAYAAAMNGLNTIIFTGGVGENGAALRSRICRNLSYLGVALDENSNQRSSSGARLISAPYSSVYVMVIPTNEEWMIAKQTYALLHEQQPYRMPEPVG
ncbi:acetate/propionate family kinase [Paenibacillus daejeonensis]|uniref:acetate/propionate family kinase n=1 Tax=Paenibacillus daejeonensis TaxID=135193 RepID=UPI00037B92DD|nr:acetate kinase [Paenibacillus daejeonensis]